MLFFSSIFRLHGWRDLKAFIPTGNQPEPFLCQFSPTPQFRRALSPTNPTMKDLSSFSLSTSDIFFWLLPLCRHHAAYANTHSFIRGTPPLNKCSPKWGHTCTHLQRREGAWKHAHITISRFACPLWHSSSNTERWQILKRADARMVNSRHLIFYLYV